MNKREENLINELRNKEYRDAFVSELIDTGIPFHIHALREQRSWTQKELGEHAGMAQETISRLEDPNYGKLSLTTLKRLASAFDIGLLVRFVPLSELVDWELHLTPDSLKALSFAEESYFKEIPAEEESIALREATQATGLYLGPNVISLLAYKGEKKEKEQLLKQTGTDYKQKGFKEIYPNGDEQHGINIS